MITFISDHRTFFLSPPGCSYVIKILSDNRLIHMHWGKEVSPGNLDFILDYFDRPFSPATKTNENPYSLDVLPSEYPTYGSGDFRSPAIEVFQQADGSRILDLRYSGHRTFRGKSKLDQLPSTFASEEDAETLVISLIDSKLELEVELSYTVFASLPILSRSCHIINNGDSALQIRRALSVSVDLSSTHASYRFVHLSGAYARERDIWSAPLRMGIQSVESRRGASSHQHNPFIALTELPENEVSGEVFGLSLVYSGNFLGLAEVDSHQTIRLQLGINPFDFAWELRPGDSFQTPEAILAYSANGLESLSHSFHRLFRNHLCRSKWSGIPRPILVNNWEATYFSFNAAKLEEIACASSKVGLELFVLDDGWFGKRNDDKSSLGDWRVNETKIEGGLVQLVERVKSQGLQFGLWFEPEMISPDSDLYRKSPDWCLHVPGRERTHSRNQLVLDFSRDDVRDGIFEQIATILRTLPVSYIKWDMNRNLTEVCSSAVSALKQQEVAHRYILGVYNLLDRILDEFPDILLEGCAGGGGRFDAGMLYYMPQIWTSDNSDAISRLRIQYGTSLVYPWSAIAAHVSVSPNHQLGRITPFQTRADVAMTGAFGYEMDITHLSESEAEEVKDHIARYKDIRDLLSTGDFYRLRSPFQTNEAAWMIVAQDQKEAIVVHVNILATANPAQLFLPLRGLIKTVSYEIELCGHTESFRGDMLTSIGLVVPRPQGDFVSSVWRLKMLQNASSAMASDKAAPSTLN